METRELDILACVLHKFVKMAKIITLAELKKHTGAKDLWIAIGNKVYDVSKFADVVRTVFLVLFVAP